MSNASLTPPMSNVPISGLDLQVAHGSGATLKSVAVSKRAVQQVAQGALVQTAVDPWSACTVSHRRTKDRTNADAPPPTIMTWL